MKASLPIFKSAEHCTKIATHFSTAWKLPKCCLTAVLLAVSESAFSREVNATLTPSLSFAIQTWAQWHLHSTHFFWRRFKSLATPVFSLNSVESTSQPEQGRTWTQHLRLLGSRHFLFRLMLTLKTLSMSTNVKCTHAWKLSLDQQSSFLPSAAS